MSRRIYLVAALAALIVMPLAAQKAFRSGDAELDKVLTTMNVEAGARLGPFIAELSVSFGVPQPQIQG